MRYYGSEAAVRRADPLSVPPDSVRGEMMRRDAPQGGDEPAAGLYSETV